MIKLLIITIVDKDTELKMKISRKEYLQSRYLWSCNFISI